MSPAPLASPELPHTIPEGFWKDVVDIPDDVPRLVWADWLEDNGDSALAEYIRTQVAPAPEHARPLARVLLESDE